MYVCVVRVLCGACCVMCLSCVSCDVGCLLVYFDPALVSVVVRCVISFVCRFCSCLFIVVVCVVCYGVFVVWLFLFDFLRVVLAAAVVVVAAAVAVVVVGFWAPKSIPKHVQNRPQDGSKLGS